MGSEALLRTPFTAILYTIVENCCRLGINTREYLEEALTRLPAMKASEAASLTPANWLAARTTKGTKAAARSYAS